MIREAAARTIVRRLLVGEHYLVIGREYVGKSSLLALIFKIVRDEQPPDVTIHLIDFAEYPDSDWTKAVCANLFDGHGSQQVGDSLLRIIRRFHGSKEKPVRLLLLFDHVDRLPAGDLRDFSAQCSAVIHELAAAQQCATSMLWCGEEVAMEMAFKQTDAFWRRTLEYRALPYTREEVFAILDDCAGSTQLRFTESLKSCIFEMTGGLPALVQGEKGSFTHCIVAPLENWPLLYNVDDAVRGQLDPYLKLMLERVVQTPSKPHDNFPAYVVSRIERDERFLNLALQMALPRATGQALLGSSVPYHDEDLLTADEDGCVRFRGAILQEFIRRVFDLHRLGLAFFFLDESMDSLGKASLCLELAERSIAAAPEFHSRIPPLPRTLSHASRRFHLASTQQDVLTNLVFIVRHLLAWVKIALLEIHGSSWRVLRNAVLPEDSRPDALLDFGTGQVPFVVDAALKDRQAHWQPERHLVAVPLSIEGEIRFVVCAQADNRQGVGDGSPPSYAERLEVLQALAAIAEGPLEGIARRTHVEHELLQKQRELALLRGVKPFQDAMREPLTRAMERALRFFHCLGLRARVVLTDPIFGQKWVRESSPPPPEGLQGKGHGAAEHGRPMVWVHKGRCCGVMELIHESKRLGWIEFADRKTQGGPQDVELLSSTAALCAAQFDLVAQSSRHSLFRFIFDHVASGMQAMDKEFNVLAINKPLLELMRNRDGFREDWHSRKCYQIHRPSGQTKPCDFCTTVKARDRKSEFHAIEQWDSPKFPVNKKLWHFVQSTPIFDGNEYVGAVEISRPPTVGEVFAELSLELLGAKDPVEVMKILAKGCLMLGFDRCRLYWIDPFTSAVTLRVRTEPGKPDPLECDDRPIELASSSAGQPVIDRLIKSLVPCLIRRTDWSGPTIHAEELSSQNILALPSLPFSDELAHEDLQEILLAPFVFQERLLGFISADFILLRQAMNTEDIRRLREFSNLATQFILATQRGEQMRHLLVLLAHQSNQPLQAILSRATELNRTEDAKTRQQVFDSIQSVIKVAAASFESHTRYFRELHNPEAPRRDLKRLVRERGKRVRIQDLLDESVELFGSLCRERGIVLQSRYVGDARRLTLHVNRPLFHEALNNLIQNAIDAAPQRPATGGQKLIELRVTRNKGGFSLFVSDNGTGIRRDKWKTVFEPFFSESGKGFGIGLTVVRRNLWAHGFVVLVVSPMKGFSTTFKITRSIIKGKHEKARSGR